MSLSITQQAGVVSQNTYVHQCGYPVYYSARESSYASYSDFKYIFRIYDQNGLLSTNNILPNPTYGVGTFSPNLIIKSKFYNNFNPLMTSNNLFASCPGSIQNYRVDVLTYYNGNTGSTLSCNKVMGVDANYFDFNFVNHSLTSTNSKALTKRDATTKLKLTKNQYATLRFLNGKLLYSTILYTSRFFELYLTIYRANGTVDEYNTY